MLISSSHGVEQIQMNSISQSAGIQWKRLIRWCFLDLYACERLPRQFRSVQEGIAWQVQLRTRRGGGLLVGSVCSALKRLLAVKAACLITVNA